MRGKKILHNDLVPKPKFKKGEQGQRNAFLEERKDMMACRYYYHALLCAKTYEAAIFQLQKEFNVSADWATKNLLERSEYLREMRNNNITSLDLRKKYDWYNWKVQAA